MIVDVRLPLSFIADAPLSLRNCSEAPKKSALSSSPRSARSCAAWNICLDFGSGAAAGADGLADDVVAACLDVEGDGATVPVAVLSPGLAPPSVLLVDVGALPAPVVSVLPSSNVCVVGLAAAALSAAVPAGVLIEAGP